MNDVIHPRIVLLLPLVILLAVAAIAVFILIFAGLRVFGPHHAGNDGPARVYVRRGLAFAAAGVGLAIVGRMLGVGSPLIVGYIPLAMVALGGLSALRAFLGPGYAGARGPGGIGQDADPGTAGAGRTAWSPVGGQIFRLRTLPALRPTGRSCRSPRPWAHSGSLQQGRRSAAAVFALPWALPKWTSPGCGCPVERTFFARTWGWAN